MSFYEDLSPYVYLTYAKDDGRKRVNVGWLEKGKPYEKGPTPPELLTRLAALNEWARAMQTRGYHYCTLCDTDESEDDPNETVEQVLAMPPFPRGSSELRIVGKDGTIFCAPEMIHHYVKEHGYRPPDAFIEAALANAHLEGPKAHAARQCLSCGTKLEFPYDTKSRLEARCPTCAEDYFGDWNK